MWYFHALIRNKEISTVGVWIQLSSYVPDWNRAMKTIPTHHPSFLLLCCFSWDFSIFYLNINTIMFNINFSFCLVCFKSKDCIMQCALVYKCSFSAVDYFALEITECPKAKKIGNVNIKMPRLVLLLFHNTGCIFL